MLFAIPFLSFLVGLLAGHTTLRAGRWCGLAGLILLLTVVGVWALRSEGAAVGLDVFLYTFAFWGAVVPAAVALGLGALLGWIALRADADHPRAVPG